MESETGLVKTGWAQRLVPALGAAGRSLLDQVFPPICLGCGVAVGTPDGLCASCWGKLTPISAPLCPVLGLPFAADLGDGAVSAQAIADPPPFDRARSAVAYTDLARQLVSRMKYGDRPEIAVFCGRMMAAAGYEVLGADAVLVPVPLHPARQFARRYNQSTELARAIARLAKCPVNTDLVMRHRHTSRQVGLSARERARNVEGAFRVNLKALQRFGGKRAVLVDDVMTTGATARALTKALKRAGIAHVDVLSFARVVFDGEMTI
ncbi:ComF family protein [Pelagibacterium xiamenense]|uniref:ComF family protein n=1 Tax=Pelagibacterium xiamenense TaxID=2901140 RepID=UPI001E29E4B0|nr:ComF family protein [Pelagibacterium xiamenense]MCD7061246.1 ComF family protein [Pelagibacterium xiamenense]